MDRIGVDDALAKIDALMDWSWFSPILKRGLGRSGVGPQGYDPLVLFKCLLIGQWHGLSDPKLERALKVRLDFMILRAQSARLYRMRRPIVAFATPLVKGGWCLRRSSG